MYRLQPYMEYNSIYGLTLVASGLSSVSYSVLYTDLSNQNTECVNVIQRFKVMETQE